MQSLSNINPQGELMPRDCTAMIICSTAPQPQTLKLPPPNAGEQGKDHNAKIVDKGTVVVLGNLLKRTSKKSCRE